MAIPSVRMWVIGLKWGGLSVETQIESDSTILDKLTGAHPLAETR